ncbi:WhiB family transcriptional regulator [Neoactinobaculum massilliense]|uniref:WhiB family transcriptional regulator n=1 Tax=Neoactinobaculum massilliense TaxID=2364794 RepID=UPI000F538C6F|nr:WhiB family transcriptional regulator [Neoactinobaculum massilliense]
MDWRRRASCLNEDPELFFPVGSTGQAAHQIEHAKSICAACPVMSNCLAYALETGQEAGIWGGMSEEERRSTRRRNARRRRANAAL